MVQLKKLNNKPCQILLKLFKGQQVVPQDTELAAHIKPKPVPTCTYVLVGTYCQIAFHDANTLTDIAWNTLNVITYLNLMDYWNGLLYHIQQDIK